MAPMQVEQSIAEAGPAHEARIVSFQRYDDAYEFCKGSRSVGLIMLFENCGDMPFEDVFRELAKQYEVRGLPCFGVLLREGGESFRGLRALLKESRLIEYISFTDLTSAGHTAAIIESIWDRYVDAFDAAVFPRALQESLSAAAEQTAGKSALTFYERSLNLLQDHLNLSWLELVSVKWQLIVEEASRHHAVMLQPHARILRIAEIACPTTALETLDLLGVITSKEPLCQRFAAVLKRLTQQQADGQLFAAFDALAPLAKPGAPALLRHLVANRARIESFAIDGQKQQTRVAS